MLLTLEEEEHFKFTTSQLYNTAFIRALGTWYYSSVRIRGMPHDSNIVHLAVLSVEHNEVNHESYSLHPFAKAKT